MISFKLICLSLNLHHKLPKNSDNSFYFKCCFTLNSPKCHRIYELLLKDFFSLRTFKNCPIWSHCESQVTFKWSSLLTLSDLISKNAVVQAVDILQVDVQLTELVLDGVDLVGAANDRGQRVPHVQKFRQILQRRPLGSILQNIFAATDGCAVTYRFWCIWWLTFLLICLNGTYLAPQIMHQNVKLQHSQLELICLNGANLFRGKHT